MLVLTRKINEKIIVGGDIVITLVSINENQVRIGIDAPHNISIDREEIWERKRNGQARVPYAGTDLQP